MDQEQQDPYEALNIPRNATQSQIKSAYRKLALKYHPDRHRNQSEETRKQYSDMFTKIGNAYEILGDEKRKERYDRFGVVDGHDDAYAEDRSQYSKNQRSSSRQGGSFHDPFGGFGSFFGGAGDPFMNDPFFNGGRRGGNGRRNNGGFMDPFEIFQEFFGEDFSHNFHNEEYMSSGQSRNGSQRYHRQEQQNGGGFNDGFGNMGMGMNMGGFGSFGGFGGGHMNAMNAMMNMQSNFPGQGHASSNGSTMYYSSSSSSNFGGGGGGSVQESVSTSTRIINGKRQTVTERVKVHPDGRVERTTETTGDDDFPEQYRLQQGNGHGYGHGQYLEQDHGDDGYQHEQKQEERRGVVHKDSSSSEPHKKRRFFTRR